MRLLVLSDIHFEHRPAWSLREDLPKFDVAIFAGDVDCSPAASVARLAAAPGLHGRPVIFVNGNHEFYGGVIEQRLKDGLAACAGTSVRMLDRETCTIGGIRFVGATLWTDYMLFGDPITGQVACLRGLNDHRLIETLEVGRERFFMPGHAMMRHETDRDFIDGELAIPFAGKTVVVTHHAPHRKSLHRSYARDPMSAGFASDLTDLMDRGQPDLWVHGHLHNGSDYRVGSTRVVCNPKGYGPSTDEPKPENRAFDDSLMIEL